MWWLLSTVRTRSFRCKKKRKKELGPSRRSFPLDADATRFRRGFFFVRPIQVSTTSRQNVVGDTPSTVSSNIPRSRARLLSNVGLQPTDSDEGLNTVWTWTSSAFVTAVRYQLITILPLNRSALTAVSTGGLFDIRESKPPGIATVTHNPPADGCMKGSPCDTPTLIRCVRSTPKR